MGSLNFNVLPTTKILASLTLAHVHLDMTAPLLLRIYVFIIRHTTQVFKLFTTHTS